MPLYMRVMYRDLFSLNQRCKKFKTSVFNFTCAEHCQKFDKLPNQPSSGKSWFCCFSMRTGSKSFSISSLMTPKFINHGIADIHRFRFRRLIVGGCRLFPINALLFSGPGFEVSPKTIRGYEVDQTALLIVSMYS